MVSVTVSRPARTDAEALLLNLFLAIHNAKNEKVYLQDSLRDVEAGKVDVPVYTKR